MDWAGFLSYVVLNCITPGPNNMICMSGAAQRGFLYSLRYIFGVFLGFLAVSLLAGGFTALLYDALPAIEPWLGAGGGVQEAHPACKRRHGSGAGLVRVGADFGIDTGSRAVNGCADPKGEL